MYCKLVGINGRYTHSSLALFHVRNELESNCDGLTAEIVQLTIRDPYYEVLLRLSAGAPDAIFFSAYIWNSELVEGLIRDLRELLPTSLLVVGGPQAKIVGESLGKSQCTVIRGAVEAVGEEFYRDLLEKKLLPAYGTSFFELQDRKERFRSPYRDTDFTTHLRKRNIYYESSRGCPFSCTYCLSSAEKGTIHKALDRVREELDQIMVHNPPVLRFVDRTFNDLPDRALAIWKILLQYEGDTLFHFEIAPDRISEEMLRFLAAVPPGRFQFEIGIQSTHGPTLKAIRRKIDPEEAGDTVARLVRLNNIHLHVDLILGLPFETKESYLRSFADLFAMGSHYIQMGLLKLLPDTAIRQGANAYGYRHSHRPPYSVLANTWLDAETLQYLYWFSECVEKFYNNRYFPSIWRYFRERRDDIVHFFEQLLECAIKGSLFQLAPTQQLLFSLLTEVIDRRKDRHLLRELLIFDWYRSGQKNLPSYLSDRVEDKRKLRDTLYAALPDELPGLYAKKLRNRFFKQTIFHCFSEEGLRFLTGEGVEGQAMAFLLEREKSLAKLQKTALLPVGHDT